MKFGTESVLRSSRGVAYAAALFAFSGIGCDEGGSSAESAEETAGADEQAPVDDGVLELGLFTEERVFVPYQGGEVEVVELGLQGGYHIFVDGRLRPDVDLTEVVVELTVTMASDGSAVTRIRHQRAPDIPDADGWPTLPEMIIFIPDPTSVYDQDVRVDVSVESLDGTLLDVLDAELHLVSE